MVKHPALVRVFAIVLAIISVISLAAGAAGFRDAALEKDTALTYSDNLNTRLETFQELQATLDNSISYDEALEELEKFQDQHDSDASQHRTDLATYSAKRGGYKMGTDALWEAKAQLAGAKAQIAQAKEQLVSMDQLKGTMNAAIAQCDAAAAECAACSQPISSVLAIFDRQPEPPQLPEEPEVPPVVPECEKPDPVDDPGEAPVEPVQKDGQSDEDFAQEYAQYEADLQEYTTKRSAYEQYETQLAAYNAYVDYRDNIKPAYDREKEQYDKDFAKYPEKEKEYQQNLQSWGIELNTAAASISTPEFQNQCTAALTGGAAALQTVAALQDMLPGGAGGAFSLSNSGAAVSAADPAQLKEQLTMLNAQLTGMQGLLGQASSGLRLGIQKMDSTVTEAIASLGGSAGMEIPEGLSTSQLIAYAESMIAKGEQEVQANLELIWYELGELEKDKAELETDKGTLDEEASKLGRMIVSTDELQELNKKYKSTKVLLTNVSAIKTAVDAGGSIETAAADYIAQYRADAEKRCSLRFAISALAVISGIAGLATIPAAFEKTKKRFWLIAPALLCLVCAASAELLCVLSGLDQHYASIFTAIFAVLYLLVALPREKKGST